MTNVLTEEDDRDASGTVMLEQAWLEWIDHGAIATNAPFRPIPDL
jgi:hypothetical protein